MTSWLALFHDALPPALNMAWDETLLESIIDVGQPVLRFYEWSEPAATFGYFQKYFEVARMTDLHPLIRRPTGGGLVPHGTDLTYSLTVPPAHAWYKLRAAASYETMHTWIQAALTKVSLPSALATEARHEIPGQCFAGAEKFDVLVAGRKIAGAAQRRKRSGLLIQGSIQLPPGLQRSVLRAALLDCGGDFFRGDGAELGPSSRMAARALELAEQKYAQAKYNEGR